MLTKYTYLKVILAASCLFSAGLYAAEAGLEEDMMAEEEGTAATEEMAAEEGMEEGMLEEAGEELPPLYTREIEAGVLYNSEDSFKFGEYTGLEEEGFYGIGNFLIRKNSVIGDDVNDYWEFSGANLGLDSRNVYGEYSHDGTYGEYGRNPAYSIFIEYDQLPHFNLDDAETPFVGAGSTNQTLPAGWVNPLPNTNGIPVPILNLHQVDVETDRKNIGGGFSWLPTDGWAITGEYHHEIKDGTETLGGVAREFVSSVLITPISFDTEEFDLNIAHLGEKGQLELGYHLSAFNNDDVAVRWESPFGGAAVLGAPLQMSQMPDNLAHVFSLSGGYNLGQTTRITGNFSYSRMEQDETFLPYTVAPGAVITTPLPRTSLDGEVDKWFANAAISMRPLPKLYLTGRYTFDFKDNNTPIDTYIYVSRDNVVQPDIITSQERINRPYGYMQHKVQLDGSYRLISRANLSAGYQYENMDRNLRDRHVVLTGSEFDVGMNEVDTTKEHTGHIKLSGSPTDRTNGWIKYLHAERDGDGYNGSDSFTYGHSDAFLNTLAEFPDFENHYLSRKFTMADRQRDQVSGNLNFLPNETFTAGVTGNYTTDDYNDSILGRTGRDNLAATLDLSYIPSENITTYAYFTHEFIDNEQAGCESPTFVPECIKSPPVPIVNLYTYDTEDSVNTVGAGMEWNAIKDKIDLALDYSFSRAITEIDAAGGKFPADALPYPDLETTIHSLNLRGDYRINKQTRIRFAYLYEYFSTDDWALDGVPEIIPTGGFFGGRVLGLGNSSPDYNAHVVGLSLIYDF